MITPYVLYLLLSASTGSVIPVGWDEDEVFQVLVLPAPATMVVNAGGESA